jgi:hypothetical protein
MLYREIIAVCSQKHKKKTHKCTVWAERKKRNSKPDGTHSNHKIQWPKVTRDKFRQLMQ